MDENLANGAPTKDIVICCVAVDWPMIVGVALLAFSMRYTPTPKKLPAEKVCSPVPTNTTQD